MSESPFAEYIEEQLAHTGLCVLDFQVARQLRPGLLAVRGFVVPTDEPPADEHALRVIAEARQAGQLLTVRLKGRKEPVLLVARSKARLSERLSWLGIEAEGFEIAEDEPAPPTEVASAPAERSPHPFAKRAECVPPCPSPVEVPEVRLVR